MAENNEMRGRRGCLEDGVKRKRGKGGEELTNWVVKAKFSLTMAL